MAVRTSRSHPLVFSSPRRSNPHRPLQISHRGVLPTLPCEDIPSPLHDRKRPPPSLCAPRGSVPRAPEGCPRRSQSIEVAYGSHEVPVTCTTFPHGSRPGSREVPELPRRLLRYCMAPGPLPPCMREPLRALIRSAQRGREGLLELQSFCCKLTQLRYESCVWWSGRAEGAAIVAVS